MEKNGFNQQGFVTQWLFAGPAETSYRPARQSGECADQLAYEHLLRQELGKLPAPAQPQKIALGQASPLGLPWRYWYRHGNWFVDVSTFYSTLTEITLCMSVTLEAERAGAVPAVLWTYCGAHLWVNGQETAVVPQSVYKPISHINIELPLRQGENMVYLFLRALGVRDTRTIAGLQLTETAGLRAAVPGPQAAALTCAAGWLDGLRLEEGWLLAQRPPLFPVQVGENLWREGERIAVTTEAVTVSCTVEGQQLQRQLALAQLPPKRAASSLTPEQSRQAFLRELGQQPGEQRGPAIQFNLFHVLARLACGDVRENDETLLLNDLAYIDRHVDCADFLVTGLIRLLHEYPNVFSAAFYSRAEETLCRFRYWMDEQGSDGMCFWSENHALMFHGAQLLAGALYPGAVFSCSGRKGSQVSAVGLARCRAWLEEAERAGLEEFNSASYTTVTLAALLNLVDYAPAEEARRAWKLIDWVLRLLARHTFDDSVISPQGRVYRDVITPFAQSVQALLHYADPRFPPAQEEAMWNVCFATSRYRFPQDLWEQAAEKYHGDYVSGHARIVLEKSAQSLLTSVCSPREETDGEGVLEAPPAGDEAGRENWNVKKLNERFHGTTTFRPGVYGYQQHMWYAALSAACVAFVNHPGSTVDLDGMRPGYWYGNGVMPALRQRGEMLLAVYSIPEEHPISFTHLYWPARQFEACEKDGNWLFGKRGKGYLAVWCSGALTPYEDVLAACEYRCVQRQTGYVCLCGAEERFGTFAAFKAHCQTLAPSFDAAHQTLTAGGETVTFRRYEDQTQFV